jgi:inner membrane protein
VTAFAAAGAAADLDLLFGGHRGATHGIGAAALVGLLVYLATRRGRFAMAIGAAYASHALLDWLGSDTSPPFGIMALWPFSREYYESSAHVFQAISRRYWVDGFWTHNVQAVARELLILLPIVAIVAAVRWHKWPMGSSGSASPPNSPRPSG